VWLCLASSSLAIRMREKGESHLPFLFFIDFHH
jgi:hypothetical protein